jgi:hypothetical protein
MEMTPDPSTLDREQIEFLNYILSCMWKGTQSLESVNCIFCSCIFLFSVVIASSSKTVKQTKQTLVLSSKRPSVGQEHNFINTTNSVRVLLTIHSFSKNMKFSVFTPWSYRGSRWWWVVNFTSLRLRPRERTPVPLGVWVGLGPGVDVMEERKISWPSQGSNPVSSSPYTSHYIDYAMPETTYVPLHQNFHFSCPDWMSVYHSVFPGLITTPEAG